MNYAPLNSGRGTSKVLEDLVSKVDLEKQLQELTKAKSDLEKEIKDNEKVLKELDSTLRLINAL